MLQDLENYWILSQILFASEHSSPFLRVQYWCTLHLCFKSCQMSNQLFKYNCNIQYVVAVIHLYWLKFNKKCKVTEILIFAFTQPRSGTFHNQMCPPHPTPPVYCWKIFSVSIFQCSLAIWRAKKNMLGENSHFQCSISFTESAEFVLWTHTPQYKDTHSTKIHYRSKHWSAWVCKIGHSLHNSLKHPTGKSKAAGELAVKAIMHSWLHYLLSAHRDKIPSGLLWVMYISVNLWVCTH